MSILKHLNRKYSGTTPVALGDRYYTQDLIRDFRHAQDIVGQLASDLMITIPRHILGGAVTKGAGDTLNITAGRGWVQHSVEIPDTFSAFPPSKVSADISGVPVWWTQQTNLAIASATLNGSATNYVKVRYNELDGNTRVRAKSSGTYSYETVPSFTFVVNTVAPTVYDLCLASLVGTAGGAFTFGVVGLTSTFTLYPVGSFYVQYPDAASNVDATAFPTSARPATMFGGTWVEQFNTENVFFRTAGTDYQTRNAGLSVDQLQSHTHGIPNFVGGGASRALAGSLDSGGTPVQTVDISARNGAVTEPRNRLAKYWKRTVL